MARSLSTFLLAAVLTGTLAACDSVTDAPADTSDAPAPAAATGKLRHWNLAPPRAEGTAARNGTVEMIVTFDPSVTNPVTAANAVFTTQGVIRRTYYRDTFSGVSVTVPEGQFDEILDDLVASDLVDYVEPDLDIAPRGESYDYVPLSKNWDGDEGDTYPTSPSNGQVLPWDIDKIEGRKSTALSGNGSGAVDVDVYVIDTDVAHADLNVVERRSFLPAGTPAAPAVHGTHVAGTLAAVDDGDGLSGVAPGARIHALSVVQADGTSQMSTLIDAVEYVTVQKHAFPSRRMVVNFSIGAYVGTTQLNALDEAIQRSVAAGVTYVVSAGNGARNASLYSPAHVPEVITVGAYDSQKRFATTFSNFGAGVDILAPGVRVVSAADANRWAMLSGTSMATPHVTGAAALILARFPTWSPAQIRAEIVSRGKDGEVSNTPSGTTRRTVWLEYL